MSNVTNAFPLAIYHGVSSVLPSNSSWVWMALPQHNYSAPYPVSIDQIRKIAISVRKSIKYFNEDVTTQNAEHLMAVLQRKWHKIQVYRGKDYNNWYLDRLNSFSQLVGKYISSLQEMKKSKGFYPLEVEKEKTYMQTFLDWSSYFISKISLNIPLIPGASAEGLVFEETTNKEEIKFQPDELQKVKTAIENDPKNGKLYLILGAFNYNQRLYREAYDSLTTALSLNYATGEVFFSRGLAASMLERHKVAYDDLIKAQRVDPERYSLDGTYFYFLGLSAFHLNKHDGALPYFSESLRFLPAYNKQMTSSCHFYISQIQFQKDQLDLARHHIEKAMQSNVIPSTVSKYVALKGIIEFIQNPAQFEQIQQDLHFELLNGPGSDPQDEALSLILTANKPLHAKLYLEKLTVDSKQPIHHFYMSMMHFFDSDIINSIHFFRNVIRFNSNQNSLDTMKFILQACDLLEDEALPASKLVSFFNEKTLELWMHLYNKKASYSKDEFIILGLFYFFSENLQSSIVYFKEAAKQDSSLANIPLFLDSLQSENDQEIRFFVKKIFDDNYAISQSTKSFAKNGETISSILFALLGLTRFGLNGDAPPIIKKAFSAVSTHMKSSFGFEFQQLPSTALEFNFPSYTIIMGILGLAFAGYAAANQGYFSRKKTPLPQGVLRRKPLETAASEKPKPKVRQTLPKEVSLEEKSIEKLNGRLEELFAKSSVGLNFESHSTWDSGFRLTITCSIPRLWLKLRSDEVREKYVQVLSHLIGTVKESKTIENIDDGIRRWLITYEKLPDQNESFEEHFKAAQEKLKQLDATIMLKG